MDALLLAALESPPAIEAPAPEPRKPEAPTYGRDPAPSGRLFPRAQLGIGGGSSGFAGAYSVGLDYWFHPELGVGVEGFRGTSGELSLFGVPARADWLDALRFRAAARVRLMPQLAIMGTVLAGVGWQRTKDVDSVSCLDCYESEYVVTRKSGLAPSMGFEAIICGGDGVVCAGAALRADFAGSVSLVTFGPVFGFEF